MAMRVRIRPPKIRPSFIIPRRYEIVVGIPTYNEAENIESITKIVDGGLAKFFPDKKALIINVDSNSTDRTKKIFLSAKTKTPKQYLKSPDRNVDGGLAKFFPDKKALIINVDSNSTDRTKKIFLSAKTKTPKQYLKS